jgi:hypothetical protein
VQNRGVMATVIKSPNPCGAPASKAVRYVHRHLTG